MLYKYTGKFDEAGRLYNRALGRARLPLTPEQIDALKAFLGTLTDTAFLTNPALSNPFTP